MSLRPLLPLLLLLSACPVEEAGAPGAGAPPPGGAEGGPPPGGEAPPPGDPAAMGTPGTPGEALVMPTPPGVASLVKDGKTVKISGKLIGTTKGQVDVQTTREDGNINEPLLLEVIQVTDGTFSFDAPATFDRPLYLTAIVPTGSAPSPDDLGGGADPIKLEGKDVTVEITVGKDPAWLKKLPWGEAAGKPNEQPPPDGSTPGPAPAVPAASAPPAGTAPAGTAPAPAAGAAPAGAPPAGAPPAGAPPAGSSPG